MSIFRQKCIDKVRDSANTKDSGLHRSLSFWDLLFMGLGAIVGTGIFVITGITAAELSGPAVILSYLVAGISCIFVALSYTEVASMIPTSGSVYAYSYVSLGEIVAWIVGWVTILYLVISASTVASGWSGYMVSILEAGEIYLPDTITKIPSEGGFVNLPAVLVSLFVTCILVVGTKESAKFNNILVFVKITAIFLFVFFAAPHFDITNWWNSTFAYDKSLIGSSSFAPFGIAGIAAGAGLVFFGYNGFDTLATAAEECKNPEKDITKAILASLIICILLYMLVAGMLVGIAPWDKLGIASPLAYALSINGNPLGSAIVATGAVAGMTTVILLQSYAQSRMFFVMARDGMMPKSFSKIHPRFKTPYVASVVVGISVAVISGFAPLDVMGSLASMGALFSFMMVSIIMLVLRKQKPEIKRPFKCPLAFVVAPIAIILCSYLMLTLFPKAGVYFMSWFVLGIVMYFLYARKNSNLSLQTTS